MNTVLCTNGMLHMSLAAVRSLGSHNIRTISAEKIRFHTSGFSNQCSKSLICPDPQKYPDLYLKWLIETIQKEKIDVLFSMDDDTTNIAINNRQQLESLCRLPIPPKNSYLIASDKAKTIQLAMKTGVPCPLTVETNFSNDGISDKEILKLTSHMEYPLVIKPRISSGSRGIRFVQNHQQLVETLQISQHQYPDPLIQEFIPPGTKFDVCLCYDTHHQLMASFIQKQIRNYPIGRGPSTVHESAVYPELLEHAVILMNNLPWYGVADIEFMIDPRSGQPKLMEINPRFWSSTHLAIRCGIDFPWILYQLAMGKEVEPSHDYIVGKRGRSLFPGDTLHFLSNPNRMQMEPKFWTTKIPDDIFSWKDPLPTIGFAASASRYLFDINKWKFLIRR
mgnify:FL=1